MENNNEKKIVWIDKLRNINLSYLGSIMPNKKVIYIFLYSSLILFVSLLIYLFIQNKTRNNIVHIYYGIMNDFSKKIQNVKTRSLKPSDEEVVSIIDRYKKMVRLSNSTPESYLAYFNMGTIYYLIENYDQAIVSFSKSLSGVPFKYQALLNMGHSFFNIGYDLHKDLEKSSKKDIEDRLKTVDTIRKNYLSALGLYKRIAKEYKDVYKIHLYMGLVQESMGDLITLQANDPMVKLAINNNKNFGYIDLKIGLKYYNEASENYVKHNYEKNEILLRIKMDKLKIS